jgi:ABC-type arginine/histidine transport system permease subunit
MLNYICLSLAVIYILIPAYSNLLLLILKCESLPLSFTLHFVNQTAPQCYQVGLISIEHFVHVRVGGLT